MFRWLFSFAGDAVHDAAEAKREAEVEVSKDASQFRYGKSNGRLENGVWL